MVKLAITGSASERGSMATTTMKALNREASLKLYAVPGVVEVRREDTSQGTFFWAVMQSADVDAIERLVAADLALTDAFPGEHLFVERIPAGHLFLQSPIWLSRHRIPDVHTFPSGTSGSGRA